MSVAKVLKLAEHRDRRSYRLALARTLLQADRSRLALVEHLSEVAEVTGSDRVAAVWIDEYGPGLVHPHVVVDLLSDRPRRIFAVEPLQKAWDLGVPGAFDDVPAPHRDPSATFAVALGSDGARGWFLVADSLTRRIRLDADRRERIMYLAGECSAIVLHRDLDASGSGEAFAGWPFLKDLEGHEENTVRSEIVGRRFDVGRLVCGLVEEDLCMADERRHELAERVRASLSGDATLEAGERDLLHELLSAYDDGDLEAVAARCLAAGGAAEGVGHPHGALELYRCGYETAAALGNAEAAVDAARFSGRILRRRGRWEEAQARYDTAIAVAEMAGLQEMIARTRAGRAVILKERGDFAGAREGLFVALEAAEAAKDGDATASIYQDLMSVEHSAGDYPQAARYGWRAVNTFTSEEGRARCLVGFGWVLKELGDLDAAEDAYAVACRTAADHYYRIYAHDAYAHIAALKGDADAFDERAQECDALGWQDGPHTAKAEVLYFRGLGHGVLGRTEESRSWLELAVSFAEEHGINRVLDGARAALARLSGEEPGERPHPVAAPPEVRDGLRAMRCEVTGVGA